MTARTPDILEDGALVVRDFVTPAEERRILERIAAAPWLLDLNRRVQHYGFRYDYTNPGAREPAAPFPLWTEHMARRLLEYFGGVLPTQCIVNEYRPGQGIGMHTDHRDFGAAVASLSLADDWPMRFRPRNARPYVRHGAPGDRVLTLPRRSVWCFASAPGPSGCTASIPRTPPAGAPLGSRPRSARLRADEPAPERRREVESGPVAG